MINKSFYKTPAIFNIWTHPETRYYRRSTRTYIKVTKKWFWKMCARSIYMSMEAHIFRKYASIRAFVTRKFEYCSTGSWTEQSSADWSPRVCILKVSPIKIELRNQPPPIAHNPFFPVVVCDDAFIQIKMNLIWSLSWIYIFCMRNCHKQLNKPSLPLGKSLSNKAIVSTWYPVGPAQVISTEIIHIKLIKSSYGKTNYDCIQTPPLQRHPNTNIFPSNATFSKPCNRLVI